MSPKESAKVFYPRVQYALDLIQNTRLTSTQIRAFLAVARKGSYVEASAKSGRAGASLHRAISDLEAGLGQNLIQRRGRGIELTKSGRSAFRRFNFAENELKSGLDELDALRGRHRGRIRIGAMPLCRARVLPEAIVKVQAAAPESTILVAEGSRAELIDPLRDGELDLMIGAIRSDRAAPDLVQEVLFKDWPAVIARAHHPIFASAKHKARLKALAQYDWCLPPDGVPLRDLWMQTFESAGLTRPRVPVECGSVMTIRQVLMNSDHLALLSPDQVAVELEAGWLKIVQTEHEADHRTIGIIYRENWRPTRLQRDFLNELKNAAL